jgi:hypothetical protein
MSWAKILFLGGLNRACRHSPMPAAAAADRVAIFSRYNHVQTKWHKWPRAVESLEVPTSVGTSSTTAMAMNIFEHVPIRRWALHVSAHLRYYPLNLNGSTTHG